MNYLAWDSIALRTLLITIELFKYNGTLVIKVGEPHYIIHTLTHAHNLFYSQNKNALKRYVDFAFHSWF